MSLDKNIEHQGRAETFRSTGAQSSKSAHIVRGEVLSQIFDRHSFHQSGDSHQCLTEYSARGAIHP